MISHKQTQTLESEVLAPGPSSAPAGCVTWGRLLSISVPHVGRV